MAKEKFSVKNKTRFIDIQDGRIVFTVFRDGVKDYADYDDTLYKILTMNRANSIGGDILYTEDNSRTIGKTELYKGLAMRVSVASN